MDCIDIGTMDVIAPLILKQEGAKRVVAADLVYRETFELVRERLNLDVDYILATLDNYQLLDKLAERDLPQKYDLVVLAGVIYHNYDPLVVLMHARKLLKPEGLIIVETAYYKGDEVALYFNPEAPNPVNEPNTYFIPTVSCLHAMLKFVSCNPLATIINGARLGVIAQACKPDSIIKKTPTLDLIIQKGVCYGPIKYKELQDEVTPRSWIRYDGKLGKWSIDMYKFTTRFQLQPRFTRR